MQFGKLKLLQIFERNWNDLPLKYWTIISFVDIKWETSDQLWAQLSASSHLNEETKFFEAFTFPWFLYYTAWFIFNSSAIGITYHDRKKIQIELFLQIRKLQRFKANYRDLKFWRKKLYVLCRTLSFNLSIKIEFDYWINIFWRLFQGSLYLSSPHNLLSLFK